MIILIKNAVKIWNYRKSSNYVYLNYCDLDSSFVIPLPNEIKYRNYQTNK